jgi:hypothetical protein
MKLIIILWITMLLVAQVSRAQNFKLLRYEEDYSSLKDSARNFYNLIKFIPLNPDGSTYLSFGGGIRQELDRATNEDWGATNAGTDVFSLQRYDIHADVHIGSRVRFFGQLRSGLEFGRRNGPRPIDEDKLNVQNLFVDIIPYHERDRSLTVRVGRQEIQYGSGRLLDVRDGPNLRQYFDGAKVAYASSKWRVDGFLLANSRIKTGVFDNPAVKKANLWGVYSTWITSRGKGVDLYYLGIDRQQARFDEGMADELRHTVGARLWRSGQGLLYNLEFGYQFGKFGGGNISAWGGSSEIGYRYDHLSGSPTVKLRADFISGDKSKGDGKLGTFNPLYPNGGYFGMNPQAGPVNIWSLHPNLSWNTARKLLLSIEVVLYWRQSLQDGIYRPDGTFSLPTSGSTERYIGTAYIGTARLDIRRSLSLNLGLQYFETGKYINNVIPQHRDGIFISSLLSYKF